MKKLAIAYYSRSGNTERMAQLVGEGAREISGVHVDIIRIEEFPPERALEYDGIVVGSPTYYASMAWPIKKFFDETVVFHGKLDGKVGAAFSSAANIGGGNETTITDILNAMLVHGMIIQGTPRGDHFGPVSIARPDSRVEGQCRALGKRVASLIRKVVQ